MAITHSYYKVNSSTKIIISETRLHCIRSFNVDSLNPNNSLVRGHMVPMYFKWKKDENADTAYFKWKDNADTGRGHTFWSLSYSCLVHFVISDCSPNAACSLQTWKWTRGKSISADFIMQQCEICVDIKKNHRTKKMIISCNLFCKILFRHFPNHLRWITTKCVVPSNKRANNRHIMHGKK